MRWMKIAKLSTTLAVLATIALGALPAAHWVKAEFRAMAEKPDPVIATPEETRAILAVVLAHMEFVGLPPPPPEPGEVPRAEPKRILIVSDESLCFGGETSQSSCVSGSAERLLIPELEPSAPRKFRAELAAANRTSSQLDLSGISGGKVVSASEIQQIFHHGRWDGFYDKYPDSSGFVRLSRPVLSKDRQQALIYIAHRCGGLCGTGTIHLLARSGSSWRIVKEQMLWIS